MTPVVRTPRREIRLEVDARNVAAPVGNPGPPVTTIVYITTRS
jgi:hypothetical protein